MKAKEKELYNYLSGTSYFHDKNFAVEQVGEKNLFEVYVDSKLHSLWSYRTIVGIVYGNMLYLTLQKYSVTTTRQLNQYKKGSFVSKEKFLYILNVLNPKLKESTNFYPLLGNPS